MGQYYKPLLIGNHGKRMVLYSHDYGSGLKLTEHSYIGNSFTNAVRTLIRDNPMRVAWIGDYSDEENGDAYEKKMPHEKFISFYKTCWGEHSKKPERPESMVYDENVKGWYLVNHTQKCYLEMDTYIVASGHWKMWNGHQYLDCLDPLPLLTACGNDRGGGDFHKWCMGYENVGIWAFDKLEFTRAVPFGCERKTFCFVM